MTPENWKTVSIAEISSFIGSGITPRGGKRTYQSSGVPLIRSQNVHFGGLRLDDVAFISDEIDASMARTRLDPGDVLLNITGASIGRCTYVPEGFRSGNVNQHVCIIRCNPEVAFYKYINCFLESNLGQNQIQSLQAGLSREALNFEQVRVIKIPLPLLNEQKKIAEILGSVDDAIAATQAAINQTRKVKQGLLQQLLTRGIGHTKFKETAIGLIPESWSVSSIGQVCEVSSGGTPDRSNLAFWNGDIPWVKTGEINYIEITDTEEKITQEGLENSSAKIIPTGTLLLAMYGQGVTRGRVAILKIEAAINQACLAILPGNKVRNQFLYYFLAREYENLRDIGNETTQKNLNAGLIKQIQIPIPSIQEQEQIIQAFASVDTTLTSAKKEIQRYQILKQGLMQDLLTGRVRVGVVA